MRMRVSVREAVTIDEIVFTDGDVCVPRKRLVEPASMRHPAAAGVVFQRRHVRSAHVDTRRWVVCTVLATVCALAYALTLTQATHDDIGALLASGGLLLCGVLFVWLRDVHVVVALGDGPERWVCRFQASDPDLARELVRELRR